MIGSLTYGFYACVRMWKKLYYRPIHLIVSFVQPIFWLTIFGFIFKDRFGFESGDYLSYLLPGVCAMTVLQSSAQSGILFIKDFQSGFFGRYNFVQQSKFEILFFKIFADFTRIIVQVFIISLIGLAMGIEGLKIGFIGVLEIIAATFLFTFFYASISCLIAIRTKASEMMASFIHLFNLPIIFTSTALIPNKGFPSWLESIAYYNPLSHLSNIFRQNMIDINYPSSSIASNGFIILAVLSIICFVTLISQLKRISYD